MPASKRIQWKRKWLCLSPLLMGLITCGLAAESTTQNQQWTFERTESADGTPRNDALEQGDLLYATAMKHLEVIAQNTKDTHKNDNIKATFGSITSMAGYKSVKSMLQELVTSSIYGYADSENWGSESSQSSQRLKVATQLLKKAGEEYEHYDALYVLANMHFFAQYTQKRDIKTAYRYYQALADTGNATAQQMVGFMYSTGIGGAVKRDQAKALLHHTFAAHGGDTAAEMTLGYRSLLGIGADQKCDDAVYYYKRVAEKAVKYYLSGPPGGRSPLLPKVRLSDEDGGVYGYGASVMTDRRYRVNGGSSEKSVSIEEVLQYWRYLAQTKADFEAQLTLGQVYYQGTRSITQNFKDAFGFFRQVTDKIPAGKLNEAFITSSRGKAIGQAAGFLGRMYWRGEGVEPNVKTAYQWFELGAQFGDANSQNGLGMMYMEGIVVSRNREKAIEYFKKAANQENPDAQVNLAVEYMRHESTLPMAIRLFTMAADAKHILAYWNLAQLNYAGVGLKASCQMAVSFYKSIAERGDWLNPTVETAYKLYTKGDREGALIYYMLAAEKGYEVAQSNVAYLLDTDKQLLKLSMLGIMEAPPRNKEEEELALIYWSRSANQNNVDSRVKMGDYYYRGIGTHVDYEKAAACYRVAAEIEFSPLAMWNLGWMYENGIGVSKDFHLAKRSYDNALNANPDAYLPVKLSLVKLYVRYYWEWLRGGEVGQGLQDSTPKDNLNLGKPDTVEILNQEARRRKEIEAHDNERGHWDIGAEEELRRKYSKHMKQMEREEGEDYMDSSSGFGDDYRDEEYSDEDELMESLMILGLCLLVGWLVYVRQFRFGNQRGNEPARGLDNPLAQQAEAREDEHP
ncbi:hypothetical protein J3Q64DRAFT_1716540 [Phycomyces blakesleeanus]